jgi:hypothetical protein
LKLERLRLRATTRRYRDLGLCDRECAALAIATELVSSDTARAFENLKSWLSGSYSETTRTPGSSESRAREEGFFQSSRRKKYSRTFLAFARIGRYLRNRFSFPERHGTERTRFVSIVVSALFSVSAKALGEKEAAAAGATGAYDAVRAATTVAKRAIEKNAFEKTYA